MFLKMLNVQRCLNNISFEFFYRRPLLYICISFMAGISVSYLLRPSLSLAFIFFALTIVMSILLYFKKMDITAMILLAILFLGQLYFLLFFNVGCIYEPGREYILKVMVYDAPEISGNRTTYVVKPEDGQAILLHTYNSKRLYQYGDVLKITVKPEIPKGETNPGGFNYREYLKRKGIYAVASANEGDIIYIGKIRDMRSIFINSRLWAIRTIGRLYPEREAAFLNSLIIGDRTNLKSDIEDSFINTGIIHVLAISGQHVNILLLFIFYALRFFNIRENKRNIIAITFIGFYVIMVGAMPSVVRAFIMSATVLLGRTYDEEVDVISGLALAAFIILLVNPLNLFDVGFQLSFGATLAILLFYRRIMGYLPIKGYLAETICLTISAEIGVLPLSIYYFFRLPVYTLLANILVVPFIPVIFIFGIISIISGGIFIPLAYGFAYLNTWLIKLVIVITEFISSIPYSVVLVQRPYIPVMIAYYLLVFIAFGFIRINHKRLVLACLVTAVALGIFFEPAYKDMNITFIDIGQGDSSLIRIGRTNILVDGGGSIKNEYSDFDVGEDVLLPYLLANHVTGIDVIFVSHTDNDHLGGLLPVAEKMGVRHIIMGKNPGDNDLYVKLKKISERRNIPITYLKRGDKMNIGKITIEVLNPGENETDINNSSLVFKLSYRETDVMYTGDIEMSGEADMVKSGMDLSTDILKVPHHGSATSSTQMFLDKARPVVSVISVGKNNYGQPNSAVIERLSRYSRIYRTDRDGAVIISTDGKNIKVKNWGE